MAVDESAAKYYENRDEYIRAVISTLQARTVCLAGYLLNNERVASEELEAELYEVEERIAIMTEPTLSGERQSGIDEGTVKALLSGRRANV